MIGEQIQQQQQQRWQDQNLQYPPQAKQIHADNFEYEQQSQQLLNKPIQAQQLGHGFERTKTLLCENF